LPSTKRPTGLNNNWFSGNYLIGRTKEEVEERLNQYIELFNNQGLNVMQTYKKIIEDGLRTRNLGDFETDLRNIAPVNYKTLYTHLKKYIQAG